MFCCFTLAKIHIIFELPNFLPFFYKKNSRLSQASYFPTKSKVMKKNLFYINNLRHTPHPQDATAYHSF
jgi:hypothetical protein